MAFIVLDKTCTPGQQISLMMRIYWPKETPPSILDGTWSPPLVKKVGSTTP